MSIVGQVGRHECWTIEIDPSPALVAQSRRWLAKWRRDYHKFTQGLFYETVDAIQSGGMPYKRRGELELAEGCADYFFRRNRREPHNIRITIERINFFHADNDFDPDPNGGETALHPFVPLVIDLSSIDRYFAVDYVEGVWLKPKRTDSFDSTGPTYSVFSNESAGTFTRDGHCADYLTNPITMNCGLIFRDNQLRDAAGVGTSIMLISREIAALHRHGDTYSARRLTGQIDATFRVLELASNHVMKHDSISDTAIQYDQYSIDTGFMNSFVARTRPISPSWWP